jgi:hypothetical protein
MRIPSDILKSMSRLEMQRKLYPATLEEVQDAIVEVLLPKTVPIIPGAAYSYHEPEHPNGYWVVNVEVPYLIDIPSNLPQKVRGIQIEYSKGLSP